MLYLLPILSGVILSLPFVWPVLWPIAFVGLLPFLYTLEVYIKTKKQAFYTGFFMGLVFFCIVLLWFLDALPLSWLDEVPVGASIFLVAFYWIACSLVLSVAVALCTLVLTFFHKVFPTYTLYMVPAVWVVCEGLRTYGFSLFSFGPAGSFGAHFSFGFLGYIFAGYTPLLSFVAPLGSVYALSFLVVLGNVFLYALFLKKKEPSRILGGAVLLCIVFLFFMKDDLTHSVPNMRVALLETNFQSVLGTSVEKEEQDFSLVWEELKRIAVLEPDVIVFPEDGRFFSKLEKFKHQKGFSELNELFKGKKVFIVDSARTRVGNSFYLRAFFYDTQEGMLGTYDKNLLVPPGEYLPYMYRWITRSLGFGDLVDTILRSRTYQASTDAEPFLYQDVSYGAVFCFEIVSPKFFSDRVKDGVQIMINPSSYAWFHGSEKLERQMSMIAQTQAALHGVYIFTAGNEAASTLIYPSGKAEAGVFHVF